MDAQSKAMFVYRAGETMTRVSQIVTQLKEILAVYEVRGFKPDGSDPITDTDLQASPNSQIRGNAEDFHVAMAFVEGMLGSIDGGVMSQAVDKIRQDY